MMGARRRREPEPGGRAVHRGGREQATGWPDDEERAPRGESAERTIHQVRADGRIIGEIRADTPVFVISVAAELAGMHAQTLRSYDREGLVRPRRTTGGGRRYSQRDIELLQQVQELSQDDGVNRAGIRRIMELEGQVDALRDKIAELAGELEGVHDELAAARGEAPAENTAHGRRQDRTGPADESPPGAALVAVRGAMVPWRARTTTVVTIQHFDDEPPPAAQRDRDDRGG